MGDPVAGGFNGPPSPPLAGEPAPYRNARSQKG